MTKNIIAPKVSIIGFAGGILFLSPNLTGNVIADFAIKTTSFVGAGLLVLGLIADFFVIKNRKKESYYNRQCTHLKEIYSL